MRTWSWFLILWRENLVLVSYTLVLAGRVSLQCKQLNMHKACVRSMLSCSCWCFGEYIGIRFTSTFKDLFLAKLDVCTDVMGMCAVVILKPDDCEL